MARTRGTPSESAIREAERLRISRKLHDSTSQFLVALELQLGELRRFGAPMTGALLDEMAQVLREIRNSISEITSGQSDEDEIAEGTKGEVAKIFYSLGGLTRSA